MNQNLQNLYLQKAALKEQIKIAETGNDSYDLSLDCQNLESALFELNQKIRKLEKEISISLNKNF